ncbi:RNA triphosphatase [Trypanosoma equiperdum]|uniref:mRNA-capping enzyme triphosphatase n=4 Tax=Trypanozoon TaxID=39700 RepID=CET1_TRYB2|nr:hypothetical protein, conserved [Trypanosoma brucei gambiense DAL972]XP_843813.1 hypothetical protein, conserved [Trypanosoma brucei brucei TREU927]AAX80700.1 hypothetical protein, conserved [Trypanosoma brucei]RHW73698.1 RNA triphosphatase [Trypanosoma brucei equiperdum]SCU70653.1 RNA triphosphatase [Trypanosoma equiperdum]AAZ10254.1 hypothetical protein, conserved [Trypanosoma brucei brucei TREU927]CBH09877.1 hypothetical protein, conserved [Trypanosoma brucei gambiense DAL972]|eukprot:XP_011772170.1 hypothetical protein, conserved [Trypanosoma brucei gambiense DAL972]
MMEATERRRKRERNERNDERRDDCEVLAKTDEKRTIVEELFQRLQSLDHTHMELEARLCRRAEVSDKSGSTSSEREWKGRRARKTRTEVMPGVAEEDYKRIEEFCLDKGKEGSVTRSTTRDVSFGQWRYTYTSGKPSECIACIRKERLFVLDVPVPSGAYDIRFSACTEITGELPSPNFAPTRGYTRHKDRLSVTDGLFRYDLTRVRDKHTTGYEVEVEFLLKDNDEKKITDSHVEELVGRALSLATLTASEG